MKPLLSTRNFCFLFALLFVFALTGCAAKPAMSTFEEHSDTASMESALATIIYYPDGSGGITAEEKRLPWEVNMGNYALSFVLEAPTRWNCRTTGANMAVELENFPVFEDAASEQAMIVSMVNTLSTLPGVETVSFTFDGERLAALKNGTPVNEAFAPLPLTNAFEPAPTPEA